jgi:SOS response regulatory protein OraA/RecX
MPSITDIQALEKDPNFAMVYVDGALHCTLPRSTVEELALAVDQEWTEECDSVVTQLEQIDTGKSMALDLISRKAWGVRELAARLMKRGIDANIARVTTEELAEDGWLDDITYAGARIRDWTRLEPASRRWLRMKLQERLISREDADQAIDEELAGSSEQDLATTLAGLRLAKVSNLDEVTARRRVISALSRRGFSTDVGSEAIRRAQAERA